MFSLQRMARSAGACVVGVALAFLSAITGAAEPLPDHEGGLVNFNLDQVEIASFVKLVGDITGRKFVLADDVKGRITVVSPQVERRHVYPLFVSILESAGCSVIQAGDLYRVVGLPDRGSLPAPVLGAGETVPDQGVYTKVLQLQYVSATSMRRALESKVAGGKTGGIGVIEETGHLIVTDTADALRRIDRIIAEIDRPGATRTMELLQLKFATADSLAEQLNLAMAETAGRGDQLKRRLPTSSAAGESGDRLAALAVPSSDSNSLILVGTASQIVRLKELVAKMDVDVVSGRGRLNAIFLRYMEAEEIAASINALLEKSAGSGGQAGSAKSRTIAIEANTANNALLVDASAGDLDVVKKLIDQLDRVPQQVHIRVVIMEHSLGEGLDLGVQMASVEMPSSVGDTTVLGGSMLDDSDGTLLSAIQQGLFPSGLSVGVAYGTREDEDGNLVSSYPALININALRKSGKLKIVSETSLEAQNNREASVNIVNEIPILKSTVEGGSGTSRDIIQNIERVDVGIKLTLTPHIIMPDRDVQMVLNPSIETVVESSGGSVEFTPTIAKRDVSTTVTVPDGKTIVIAGLTRQDEASVERRVPVLGSIPLIGFLFRRSVTSSEKTNILIFVTPRIVSDIASAEAIMSDLEEKSGLIHDERD